MIKEVSRLKVLFDDENNRLIFQYDDDNGCVDFASNRKDVSILCELFGGHVLDVLEEEHDFEF